MTDRANDMGSWIMAHGSGSLFLAAVRWLRFELPPPRTEEAGATNYGCWGVSSCEAVKKSDRDSQKLQFNSPMLLEMNGTLGF